MDKPWSRHCLSNLLFLFFPSSQRGEYSVAFHSLQRAFYYSLIPVLLFVAAVLVGYGIQISNAIRRSLPNATTTQRKFFFSTLWMISTVMSFIALAITIVCAGDGIQFSIPSVIVY